jgi:hypothetical protein
MLPAYKIHDIQCIQNRAMRTILGCNRYTPIALMLNVLNLMTARQTIIYNKLLTIFKIKNKIVPQYLYSKIKFISERQNYNLRNCRLKLFKIFHFDIKFSRYDINCSYNRLKLSTYFCYTLYIMKD